MSLCLAKRHCDGVADLYKGRNLCCEKSLFVLIKTDELKPELRVANPHPKIITPIRNALQRVC
jgi:hypothetical protein